MFYQVNVNKKRAYTFPSPESVACIVEMEFVASPLIKSTKSEDLPRTLISLLPLCKLKKTYQIHND